MIKPAAISKGATIGVVCPSYWLNKKSLLLTTQMLEKEGYKIILGPSTKLKSGPYAGSPEDRVADLHSMFTRTDIDAIICARGGYGANRLLPLLNFDLIKNNPKIFMGYSDITALLISITQQTGLITFHGPMMESFEDEISYNLETMETVLFGNKHFEIANPKSFQANIVKTGKAQGPLWGGNLTLISNRLATEDALDSTKCILFLEDVREYFYAFDRTLYHFRKSGLFDLINGLIIGDMKDMIDEDVSFAKSIDEIVLDNCDDLDIPIITNFACGHGNQKATLPISLGCQLNAEAKIPVLNFNEAAVKK